MDNDSKEIGGYFSLELPEQNEHYHNEGIKLNSARNCFEYILKENNVNKIYIPYYNCSVMLEPLVKTNTKYEYYGINLNLEVKNRIVLKENEYILYINYFGVKNSYVDMLIKNYNNKLIIDNSQAFFSKFSTTIYSIYSPRKFFGVADGGYLIGEFSKKISLEHDSSVYRMNHLLGRLEKSANNYYEEYKQNDNSLINQNIKKMSKITSYILSGINYQIILERRKDNFSYLHNSLKELNQLKIDLNSITVPMVYPFLYDEKFKNILIKNKIYVATYWSDVINIDNVPDNEKNFTANLIPLPIDQRYNLKDMQRIIDLIKRNL